MDRSCLQPKERPYIKNHPHWCIVQGRNSRQQLSRFCLLWPISRGIIWNSRAACLYTVTCLKFQSNAWILHDYVPYVNVQHTSVWRYNDVVVVGNRTDEIDIESTRFNWINQKRLIREDWWFIYLYPCPLKFGGNFEFMGAILLFVLVYIWYIYICWYSVMWSNCRKHDKCVDKTGNVFFWMSWKNGSLCFQYKK